MTAVDSRHGDGFNDLDRADSGPDTNILSATKKVLIVDDHNLIRRGLRAILEAHPRLVVVAEAATGREGLEAARQTHPDMAIVDYLLPELNGIDLTIELRKMTPPVEVLIYSLQEREELVVEAVRAGARGFVAKSDSELHLLAAIEAVSRHRPYFANRIPQSLLDRLASDPAALGQSSLTHREREVVQLIAEGRTNKEVAQTLTISIKTVETHRASAMQKLNLKTSAELVRYAIRSSMIEP